MHYYVRARLLLGDNEVVNKCLQYWCTLQDGLYGAACNAALQH